MIGGTTDGRASFVESLLALPRHRRDEAQPTRRGDGGAGAVGLDQLAFVRADRLQHSELRFVEIARALMLRPASCCSTSRQPACPSMRSSAWATSSSPSAGSGTGVLLVEHHADLIFDICDRVTVLNLGKVLASGTPAEIRGASGGHQCLPRRADPLARISGLSAGYGKIGVLHGIDLTVGAGKSWPFSAPMAPARPLCCVPSRVCCRWSGHIRFAGKDLAGASPRDTVRAGLVHVVEGHRVFTQLTVFDNLLLAGYGMPRRERATQVEEALAFFPEIAAKRNDRAVTLSGGQQQMLAVAQGLVRRPRLLMLDEPSAGLSPVLVDRVLAAAGAFAMAAPRSCWSSNSSRRRCALADRVYALARGSIVLEAAGNEPNLPSRLEQAYFGHSLRPPAEPS